MVYDNTPVMEYLQLLFKDQRYTIINNIFNTIEELQLSSIFNKEFDFDTLYVNLSDIISQDESYPISYITDSVTLKLKNTFIDYLKYNGIKLDTELRPNIYLFEIESILNALNTIRNLNSDVCKEMLYNIKNNMQSTESTNIDIFSKFILEEYTELEPSDIYNLIEDISDLLLYKIRLKLVELITIEDTADDDAIAKLYKLLENNTTFADTIVAKSIFNYNFKKYKVEDNINYLLKRINKSNINMLPYEIVSYLYLSVNFENIDIEEFLNDYLPNETIASLFNLNFETEYNKAIIVSRDIVDIYNIVRRL
ncbi:hypothetical protein ACVWU4_000929 [Campylobacter coli]